MIKKLLLFIFLLSILCLFLPQERTQAAPDKSYKVKVVLFVPRDYTADAKKLVTVDSLVADVRRYYMTTLGKTFFAERAVVVKGNRTANEYNKGKFDMVTAELKQKGYYPPHTKLFIVMHPHKTVDNAYGGSLGLFEGWANSPGYAPGSKENGITYIVYDKIFTTPDMGIRGVITHELGHAFSLPHPKNCDTGNPKQNYCFTTPMYNWWSWSQSNPTYTWLNTSVAPEKKTLQSSPWMWDTSAKDPVATATPTNTPTPTPTATPTPSPTPTPTPTPTPIAPTYYILQLGPKAH